MSSDDETSEGYFKEQEVEEDEQEEEEVEDDLDHIDGVVLSDDVVEIAFLLCPSCEHAEFPGCSEHHVLTTPTVINPESDNEGPIRAPSDWPVKPRPYILPCVSCVVCKDTSTACSYPWSYQCRFCDTAKAYTFCIRMRNSVKQLYKTVCGPGSDKLSGCLIYCEICHSASPLLDAATAGTATGLNLPALMDSTNSNTAASMKLAWSHVTSSARKLEHFSPQCAFAERVALLSVTYVAEECQYLLDNEATHRSAGLASEVQHLPEDNPSTHEGDDEIATSNRISMHWGAQRLLAEARLTPAAAPLPPLKR